MLRLSSRLCFDTAGVWLPFKTNDNGVSYVFILLFLAAFSVNLLSDATKDTTSNTSHQALLLIQSILFISFDEVQRLDQVQLDGVWLFHFLQ